MDVNTAAWRAVYDSIADEYDGLEARSGGLLGKEIIDRQATPGVAEDLLNIARVRPGMSVLDVGTGTGIVARAAGELVGGTGQVLAIDVSKRMLNRARKATACRTIKYRALDVADMTDVEDKSFDVAVAKMVLIHVSDPIRVFAEILRVLRPGGLLVASYPCPDTYTDGPAIARLLSALPQGTLDGMKLIDRTFRDHCMRIAGFGALRTEVRIFPYRTLEGAKPTSVGAVAMTRYSEIISTECELQPLDIATYPPDDRSGGSTSFDVTVGTNPNPDLSCAQQNGRWHRDLGHGVSCCS